MVYKVIIIEDDPIAMKSLERLVEKTDGLDLTASFVSGKEALDHLNKNQVDIVFLDVELPDLSGIEVMDKLETLPSIIMTTGNKDYAIDAFTYDVTDFIVKPVTLPKLQQSITKHKRLESSMKKLSDISHLSELYIRSDGTLVRLPIDDIYYFENVGDYVKVITSGKTHVLYGALKSIDQRITHPRLLKVHRSFIINLGKIKDIQDNSILLDNGKLIPVSRAHKSILLDHLNIL